MDLNLNGKVAVVTGGSRGLGRAICRRLATEGVTVAVNYRGDPGPADAVVEEIRGGCGAEAVAVRADVSQEAQIAEMFTRAEKALGPVEILVNNAAVCPTCWVKDLTLDQWRTTVEVNLTGTFLASRELVRRLIAAGRRGRIVNITSVAAFRGSTTGHAPYDASKGGVVSFTVSLAREVAPHGIAVNAVAPGMMYTEMTAKRIDADPEKYLSRIPLRRIGDVDEVADVVAFLASDRASYVTGATVDVSGGMLMR